MRNRQIKPEWLDELPAAAPEAIRSRQDLHRLNSLMAHAIWMTRLLRAQQMSAGLRTLVDLGAGDGTFLLRVARRIAPSVRAGVKVVLVDQQELVTPETRMEFEKLGWEVEVARADVIEWLSHGPPREDTAMMANLFLHHFEEERLRSLLANIALKSDWFAACEPRRSGFALAASRMLRLIGCNWVTRHDAVASVQGGFTGTELTSLWPARTGTHWGIAERKAGLFTHVFSARRLCCPETLQDRPRKEFQQQEKS